MANHEILRLRRIVPDHHQRQPQRGGHRHGNGEHHEGRIPQIPPELYVGEQVAEVGESDEFGGRDDIPIRKGEQEGRQHGKGGEAQKAEQVGQDEHVACKMWPAKPVASSSMPLGQRRPDQVVAEGSSIFQGLCRRLAALKDGVEFLAQVGPSIPRTPPRATDRGHTPSAAERPLHSAVGRSGLRKTPPGFSAMRCMEGIPRFHSPSSRCASSLV